jgi:hypothetical protein
MDFKKVVEAVGKFVSGAIDFTPTHAGPLEEESSVIKEDLLEFNKRNIMTVNSQPFYDGPGYDNRGIPMRIGTAVQTPYVEGICHKDMHDLMCSNADKYGYLYSTIRVYIKEDDIGRRYIHYRVAKCNNNGINLTVAYEPVIGTVASRQRSERSCLIRHFKNVLFQWDISIPDDQELFWFFFSETSLPMERPKKRIVGLKGDNSFFKNLLKKRT